MAENLDFKFEGCAIGSTNWSKSSPSAAYYANNETTYGIDGARKCGLLYNWYAVKYLEDNKGSLIPGWHVPTREEWNALINSVGENPGTKLKALNNSVDSGTWPTGWGGTDDYEFGALPAGLFHNNFSSLGSSGFFWSSSEYSSSYATHSRFGTSSSVSMNNNDKGYGFSLRLVKD